MKKMASKNLVRTLELTVLQWIQKHDLLPEGSCILVAVSGGVDSMCLLHLLKKWAKHKKWNLKVATFDHGLRKASKSEVNFVKAEAKKLGVACVVGQANTKKHQKEQDLSLEESARILRYRFLTAKAQALKAKHKKVKIALAHHLDDQVETFFVQLFKGSGLGGISGMKPKNDIFVRPLLNTPKALLTAYAKNKKMKVREDASNDDLRFLRNRIRHELLPFISKKFEINLKKTLPNLMQILKEEHELLENLTKETQHHTVQTCKSGFRVEVDHFGKVPKGVQRRTIKNILDQMSSSRNYSSSHVDHACDLFYNPNSHKVLMMPDGILIQKIKNTVFFHKKGFNHIDAVQRV